MKFSRSYQLKSAVTYIQILMYYSTCAHKCMYMRCIYKYEIYMHACLVHIRDFSTYIYECIFMRYMYISSIYTRTSVYIWDVYILIWDIYTYTWTRLFYANSSWYLVYISRVHISCIYMTPIYTRILHHLVQCTHVFVRHVLLHHCCCRYLTSLQHNM